MNRDYDIRLAESFPRLKERYDRPDLFSEGVALLKSISNDFGIHRDYVGWNDLYTRGFPSIIEPDAQLHLTEEYILILVRSRHLYQPPDMARIHLLIDLMSSPEYNIRTACEYFVHFFPGHGEAMIKPQSPDWKWERRKDTTI